MESVLLIFAIIAVILGTLFSVVGVLGYIRLPDVYTRLHSTGKIAVFGVVGLLFAGAASLPSSWPRALVFILFLLVAGPPTAHAMGSAAHRIGIPRNNYLRDDLAADEMSDTASR